MKKTLVFAAAASLSVTSAAMANEYDPSLDEVIELGNLSLEDGDIETFNVEVDLAEVAGLSFSGTVDEIGGGAWASDTLFTIDDGAGGSHFLGGFPAPGAPNDWDFQGADSSDPGDYFHGIGGDVHGGDGEIDKEIAGFATDGTWTLSFEQTWGSVSWSDVTVTIHQVPAPGALALLGVAGMIGGTRRRRS